MHLWEVDHPYYCNEGNYFASESVCDEYKSWASFAEDYKDADMDMNLVFRWDWREGEDWGAASFNGDVNYRNGHLLIFWMGQRKGIYRYSKVEVCRADEVAVIEFLRPRWEHMRRLWEPLSPVSEIEDTEKVIERLRAAIANDAYALTFQSIGQYRSALLKAIRQT